MGLSGAQIPAGYDLGGIADFRQCGRRKVGSGVAFGDVDESAALGARVGVLCRGVKGFDGDVAAGGYVTAKDCICLACRNVDPGDGMFHRDQPPAGVSGVGSGEIDLDIAGVLVAACDGAQRCRGDTLQQVRGVFLVHGAVLGWA